MLRKENFKGNVPKGLKSAFYEYESHQKYTHSFSKIVYDNNNNKSIGVYSLEKLCIFQESDREDFLVVGLCKWETKTKMRPMKKKINKVESF